MLSAAKRKKTGKPKKILLIAHDMQIAGAEIILYNLTKILVDSGYSCSIISLNDGPMIEKFKVIGCKPKILSSDFEKYPDKIIQYARCFDLVIANTVLTYMFPVLLTNKVPLIWYVHEGANIVEYTSILPELEKALLNAQNIYAVSDYAKDFIVKNYNSNVKVIHNYVEDKYSSLPHARTDKPNIDFSILGFMTYRKAIHICIDSFLALPAELREKSRLNIAGKYNMNYFNLFKHKIKKENHIVYHGEITGKEKQTFFANTDVFVIPSFDESCSLVALEGAMYGKPLIISKNVGAKYIVDKTNGWIVDTGSVEALTSAMESAIRNQNELSRMGEASRKKYIEFASYKNYKNAVLKMIEDNIDNTYRPAHTCKLFFSPLFKKETVLLNFGFFKVRMTLDPIFLLKKIFSYHSDGYNKTITFFWRKYRFEYLSLKNIQK